MTLDGEPIAIDMSLGFVVYAGPNAGQSDVIELADASTADFTYTGSGGAGTDSILTFLCDAASHCQGFVDGCIANGSACLDMIATACYPGIGQSRIAAAGSSCVGPATALKTWVAPTPTPSPTPVDVSAGGQSPAPTPVQLPASGGASGGSGAPWVLAALIGAAVTLSGGALILARQRICAR